MLISINSHSYIFHDYSFYVQHTVLMFTLVSNGVNRPFVPSIPLLWYWFGLLLPACVGTKGRTMLTIRHHQRLPGYKTASVTARTTRITRIMRTVRETNWARFKGAGFVVSDARPWVRQSETGPSSLLNSIIRSRIMAALSNSRFLAAVFMSDSSCLISSNISSLEMEVTA